MSSKTFRVGLAGILLMLGIALAAGFGFSGWRPASYADDMLAEGGKVAGALFVIAAFLERGLAVINGLLFGDQTGIQETARLNATRLAENPERIAIAYADINQLEANKQRVRLGVGFVIASLISAAGVRTLGGLVKVATVSTSQLPLFDFMDILLTAGLLAGGSNALATLMDLFKTRVQAGKARAFLGESSLTRNEADRLAWLRASGVLSEPRGGFEEGESHA